MATAISADMMLGALAKWGIVPKFYKSDWRTHNRNAAQGWGPLYGLVVHNFGSDTSDPNSLAYLYGGDLTRGMPGPLSQFAITDDGTLWVIGWGAANHTGSMDPRLLDLVKHDSAPLAADFRPNVNFNSPGTVHHINDNFVGVEMTYGAAPTAAQRATVAKLGAALMDLFGVGYTGGSVVGHREATTDRSDPVGFQMWQLRRDINALLKAGPVVPKPPTVPTAPKPPTVPAGVATTVALTVDPPVVPFGYSHTLTARITPATAAGSVQMQWNRGDGKWASFGNAVKVTSGIARLVNRPGIAVDHHYRAVFTPATSAFKAATSHEVVAPVVDLLKLRQP